MPKQTDEESFLVNDPEVSWRTLAAVAILEIGAAVVANLYLIEWLLNVRRATSGWVDTALLGSVFSLLVVVGIGILLIGRCTLSDVYWHRQKLPVAVAVTTGVWAVLQLALVAVALVSGESVVMHPAWTNPGTGFVLGLLLGQMFGNALVEETIFRGFFFPQLLRKFRHRMAGRVMPLLVALVASQVFFALSHIPNRIMNELPLAEYGIDFVGLVVIGSVHAGLFVVTRNLWVSVGMHSLINCPTLFVHRPAEISPNLVRSSVVVLFGVVAVGWWLLERRSRSAGSA